MLQRELNFLTLLLLLCQNGVKAVTLITCDGNTAEISCAQGTIKLLSADYGRKDKIICANGRPAEQLANTACSLSTTLGTITPLCAGKGSCSINLAFSPFDDPCVGTYKYLTVSYECVLPTTTKKITTKKQTTKKQTTKKQTTKKQTTTIKTTRRRSKPNLTIVICQDKSSTISCERGRSLYIHKALYGKCSKKNCPHHHYPGAVSSTCSCPQTKNLQKRCNGKRRCDLRASNSEFRDPCPRFHKCLEVTYCCK